MTELGFLEDTREGYDLTAAAYAERFHDHLHSRPLDRAMLVLALVENLQRANLNAIEEAAAYHELMDQLKRAVEFDSIACSRLTQANV